MLAATCEGFWTKKAAHVHLVGARKVYLWVLARVCKLFFSCGCSRAAAKNVCRGLAKVRECSHAGMKCLQQRGWQGRAGEGMEREGRRGGGGRGQEREEAEGGGDSPTFQASYIWRALVSTRERNFWVRVNVHKHP